MVTGLQIVTKAKKYLKVPCVLNGDSPSGFDCSGLVMYVYAQFGIKLPHYTGGIIKYGKSIARNDLKLGDIVFPSPRLVGIYVGNDQIIYAPKPGDVVKISKIWQFYAAKRVI